MIAVLRLDELRRDADLVAGFPDRAFDDVADIQQFADLAQILVLALEGEGRRAPRDAQVLYLGEDVQKLLGDAVGEIFLVLLGRHVRERKDGDGIVGENGAGRRDAVLADRDDGRVFAPDEAVADDDGDENAESDKDRPVELLAGL